MKDRSTGMERITAKDLFILCRRAAYALSKGRTEDAAEILSHAPRIAARVGIADQIIRTREECPNATKQDGS